MNLYENPLMSLGLGLLAANQPGANFGQVLGRGGLLAMENMRLGQQHAANLAKAQEAREQREAEQARREAQIEYFRQQGGDVGAFGQQFPELAAQRQAQVLMPAPEKPVTPTSLERNLQAAGFVPGTAEYQAEMIKAINKPLSQTTIEQKGTEEYIKKRQAGQVAQMQELQKQAQSAYKKNKSLDRFIAKAEKGAFAGGAAPIMANMTNFLSSFGFESDELKNTQEMQAAIANIKTNMMSELGARGLTDQDMKIIDQMLPRVDSDPRARLAIARVLKKANEGTISQFKERVSAEREAYPEMRIFTPKWLEDWTPTDWDSAVMDLSPGTAVAGPSGLTKDEMKELQQLRAQQKGR